MNSVGWKCPNCGNCYAPFVPECRKCNSTNEINLPFISTNIKCSICGNYHSGEIGCAITLTNGEQL